MALAIRVQAYGGPEALVAEEIELEDPGPGEVRVRHTAIGVNYIDTYQRSGFYPIDPPFTPGMEAAGLIDAVGDGVDDLKVGDRVAYSGATGAYATEALVPAHRLVRLPAGLDDRIAAAALLKGLTAEFLLRRTYRVNADTTLLFHAAAGGVGLIACQWAKALGATVIGTVGSAAKARLAAANGCDEVINYAEEDFVVRARAITDGRGVDVVYDGVGQATFPGSLDALKSRGMWVSFGQASGQVPDFNPLLLSRKGSLFMTRPSLGDYTADRTELNAAAAALFDVIANGSVKVAIGQEFALADAAEAHRALEGRRTIGSTLLIP